ncbi:SRPBCC family protein [uncultured Jatrophihabitans sp.]|uniref:SRPBCC family protein n=1 Tax=uncultured Jatrophihabitans sp. TaxID=1610747 RepID=UPI0035CA7730
MAGVVVSALLPCPIEVAWAKMGDFTGWHTWLGRIRETAMDAGHEQGPVGGIRTLTLADGSTVRERLVEKDEVRHSFAYVFDGPHPFPVRAYTGRVRMDPVTTTGETFVHWSGEFDADADAESKAAHVFASIYTSFLAGLAEALGSAPVELQV